MLRSSILTIILCLSPTFGLLETLFQSQNNCHSACTSKYDVDMSKLSACKKGCEFKLHSENCAIQCKLVSSDEQVQSCCLDSCSPDHWKVEKSPGYGRPRSIILIRLRQYAFTNFSSFNTDPLRMFLDKVKQIRKNSNRIVSLNDIRHDDSKFNNKYEATHFNIHQKDETKSVNNRFIQFFHDIQSGWNYPFHRQQKIFTFIYISVLFLSPIILFYMIISLYCHASRSHTTSISAQEILANEYDKVLLSKENDRYAESSTIKV